MSSGRSNSLRKCIYCNSNYMPIGTSDYYCSPICRFKSNITINNNGCWIWNKHKDVSGYGIFSHKGKDIKAHRFSYISHFGEIPRGKIVCHTCDIRACCSPCHLWVGDNKGNTQDMMRKGRDGFTGSRNRASKISEHEAYKIKHMINSNKHTHQEIADIINTTKFIVSDISRKRTWKHIKV